MATNEGDAKLLDQIERELGPAVPHETYEEALFHYTDPYGFEGIVRSKTLWATSYRWLNDAEDVRFGERVIDNVAKRLACDSTLSDEHRWLFDQFLQQHDALRLTKVTDVYIASLSEDGNLLSQWRGYAGNGAGFALGFSSLRLPQKENPDAQLVLRLVKCLYDPSIYKEEVSHVLLRLADGIVRYIQTYARSMPTLDAFVRKALVLMLRWTATLTPKLKHSAFAEERERRLVVIPMPGHEDELVRFRPTSRGIVPYIPIDLADDGEMPDLTRVNVGPTQDADSGVDSPTRLLRQLGYSAVVESSGIPFRG